MDKKDFKNLLSESFERYDKKAKRFLKGTIEKNNKFLVKKIKEDVREEFSRFVDVSIIPQFEEIHEELNDMSHRQDQIIRTLGKHEDRFDHLGSRQDKIIKVLEKQDGRLERIEAKLE